MRLIYIVLWFSAHHVMFIRCNTRYFMKNKIGVKNRFDSDEISSHFWLEKGIFPQHLDNFDPNDFKIWHQRYFANNKYFKKGGPTFLMLGGVEPIESWVGYGNWVALAKEFNATLLQLEHRYYGSSQPTSSTNTENLKYLTSEQALADAARFLEYKQRTYGNTSKVIVFGGSYAGSLAAWMRLKYPHLVHAAVSSSGPLLATLDFSQYLDAVKNSLAIYNPECVTQINLANQMLNSILSNGPIIEEKFKLCSTFDRNNKKDVALLFESLVDNIAGVVQYNPNNIYYPETHGNHMTIKYVCDIMLNKSIPSPLDRYAKVNEELLTLYEESCLSTNYSDVLGTYLNTGWDKSQYGGRQWIYQTCTEFGFFQSSSQPDHTFGHHFSVQFFIDICTDLFGEQFNLRGVSSLIHRTNSLYGGLNIKESRVLYVHGSVDPWHVLGITETNIINTKAITINGTSHCADMYASLKIDSPEIKEARNMIKYQLGQWLFEDDYINSK